MRGIIIKWLINKNEKQIKTRIVIRDTSRNKHQPKSNFIQYCLKCRKFSSGRNHLQCNGHRTQHCKWVGDCAYRCSSFKQCPQASADDRIWRHDKAMQSSIIHNASGGMLAHEKHITLQSGKQSAWRHTGHTNFLSRFNFRKSLLFGRLFYLIFQNKNIIKIIIFTR